MGRVRCGSGVGASPETGDRQGARRTRSWKMDAVDARYSVWSGIILSTRKYHIRWPWTLPTAGNWSACVHVCHLMETCAPSAHKDRLLLVCMKLFFIGYKLIMVCICEYGSICLVEVEHRHRLLMIPFCTAPSRDVRRPLPTGVQPCA